MQKDPEIILIHFEDRVREVLGFALEARFQAVVQTEKDAVSSLPHFAKKPKLVIYSYQDEKSDEFKKFLKAKLGLPAILVTTEDPEDFDGVLDKDIIACVSQIDLLETLSSAIDKLIAENKLKFQISEEYPESEFCRIRPQLLVEAGPFSACVYIRLNNQKFIKIFSEGDIFDANDLEKYFLKKKVEFFWLRKPDTDAFLQKHILQLESLLAADVIETSVATEVTTASLEAMHDLVSKIGFTEGVQDLAKTNMEIAVKALKNAPAISKLLQRFDTEKDKYIPAHSSMTAFVACGMAKQMTWSSDATYQKLTMAAFLHDLTIPTHELAMIHDAKELQSAKGKFNAEEIAAYEQHPQIAAALLKTFPTAPADVDVIIMQHHELPDGKGFPRKLSATHISPLATIFIIAHEVVFRSIREGAEPIKVIEEMKQKYTMGNFRKVLSAINLDA